MHENSLEMDDIMESCSDRKSQVVTSCLEVVQFTGFLRIPEIPQTPSNQLKVKMRIIFCLFNA